MSIDRRDFLKTAAAGAGLSLAGVSPIAGAIPDPRLTPIRRKSGQAPDVVVVGAGNFGMWTALNLVRLGATVVVVDKYGPANSRSTSGGETRGVRSSYGDRPHGLQWAQWATEAMRRWKQWDEEGEDLLLPRLLFETGDLIMRPEMEPYLEDTMANWDQLGVEYEAFGPDEINRRWPWIKTDGLPPEAITTDGSASEEDETRETGTGEITTALYEPQAGVVRARRAIESVAKRFVQEGGEIQIASAAVGASNGTQLDNISLDPGEPLSASTFIFALGPWFPKVFPGFMANRLRIPIGNVFYFGIPDNRFLFPNMPSYGVPGCTGWPALSPDHRGFRVRTGGQPGDDPDTSNRWVPPEAHERPRQILERYFPDLVGAPLSETRACHYEFGPTGNFLVDKHPEYENVWLAGSGSAESFKQGPVLGEYIAKRVLGVEDDPELAEQFKLSEEEFEEDEFRPRRSTPPF